MNKRKYWIAGLILLPGIAFVVLTLIFPLPEEKFAPPASVMVLDKSGRLLCAFTSKDGKWRMQVKLKQVSPFLKKAVLAYEDKWFYWHPGVNPVSLLRAALINYRASQVVCGGSTITMQVARMMEPRPRTYKAKLVEIFRSLQLELTLSKDEILELYLNLAPYGGNIEGVAAASWLYFGKDPCSLSVGEAALLCALPKSPTRLRPDQRPKEAKEAQAKVLGRLKECGLLTEAKQKEAIGSKIPERRQSLPFVAPHLSSVLAAKYPERPGIKSAIDFSIQSLCRGFLKEHLSSLKEAGITNGACVVIENKTGAVRALVGSYDFFDKKHSGQVNGAISPRSPGSALKPFIYALALDKGLISPEGLLADVPVDYSGYSPKNYDDKYRGAVEASEALRLSLNVPAVNLSAELKGGLFDFLKDGGITTLERKEADYGLPLILGGCEVNLLELTNLYATLARMGSFKPYCLLEDDPPKKEERLLSKGASFIITRMLSEVRRPDLPACWEFSLNLPKVAYKTGTSYGHRDAWSIGYNPQYTVGVWVGNFNGQGVPELSGATSAAGLLFDIINGISSSSVDWFAMPEDVGEREVCALSGMLPGPACQETKEEMFILGISPNKRCDIHQEIIVDDNTNFRLCPHCRQEKEYHQEVFVKWPAKIATWRQKNGYPIEEIPAHLPSCPTILAGKKPVIHSPSENCTYYLQEGLHKEYQKILLEASVSNEVKKIYWFVDGDLISTCSPCEGVFYSPALGKHRLVCLDDAGRSSEMSLIVHP